MGAGLLLGYAGYKLLPKIPYLKNNYYMHRFKYTTFMIVFFVMTYHGYKLMGFQKRKGIRELAKDEENLIKKKWKRSSIALNIVDIIWIIKDTGIISIFLILMSLGLIHAIMINCFINLSNRLLLFDNLINWDAE